LFLLALPIASIAWTVTHEEIFREPREYCVRQSREAESLIRRKFFYVWTCEYCFSHYVTAFFLIITRYKLLFDDWRGYFLAFFALPYVANLYMGLYAQTKLEAKKDRAEAKLVEHEAEIKKIERKESEQNSPAA
jgi:amino acid permease